MATPAGDPAPPSDAAPAPDAPTAAAAAAATPPASAPDPLAALGSMWNGWLSKATAAPPTTATVTDTATPAGPPGSGLAGAGDSAVLSGAAATATEWMAAAGSLWEGAVADVNSKLKSVDAGALGEQVAEMRERSGRMLSDVSRSVQSLNLSLDQEELQRRAETISSSTKQLLEKAGQSLQQGRQEALEIFVDKEVGGKGGAGVPPWDERALPDGEKGYCDALRKEMLKIVVDAIYSKKRRTELFLSGVAEREGFEFDFDGKASMAMAALEADSNMRRLRAGLVPGKMKEDAFWNTYFFHVRRVRQSLVANGGVLPEQDTVHDDEDPAALFADDGEDEELAALGGGGGGGAEPAAEVAVEKGDGKRNWDDEIDAIFDDDE